jgi:hypothetical protein
MPVTTLPQDKFAFLFTGPTDLRYRNDLINVYVTLTEYYNYLPGNIWVVWGGPDDLTAFFPGANTKSVNSEADPKQAITDQYTAFAGTVNGNTPDTTVTDSRNVALIYLTGTGYDSGPGPMDFAELMIRPGTPDVMNSEELKNMFSSISFLQSHVNLVMQQDYADKFTNDLYSNGLSSTNKSVTNVNGDQSAAGDSDGGSFTKGWIAALRMNDTVIDGAQMKHADELSYPSEPYHVSLEQAKAFAGIWNSATYTYSSLGETAILGKPAFLIQDGDNINVGWWESPDIYLTHPSFPGKEDDRYIPDDTSNTLGPWENTINVVFRNTGTHPVRSYNIGIQVVIRTPMGPDDKTLTETGVELGTVLQPTRVTGYNTFSNNNKHVYVWNTAFYTGITHECLRVKVQLPSEPVVFTWNVLANDAEAQRNTDQSSDPPKKGRIKPGDIFRGSTRHLYSIHNPFTETHKFILATTPDYQKSMDNISMKWHPADRSKKEEKLTMEKLGDGFRGIHFVLKPGEVKNIIGEFGFKRNPAVKKIRLPFEVLVNRRSGVHSRIPLVPSLKEKYSAISGFTIIMIYEQADMSIKVTDKKGNTVTDATIVMQTTNGLQKETFPAGKSGEIVLKSINPDVYRVKAITKSGESDWKIIPLSGRESIKVKVKLSSAKIIKRKSKKKKK